MTNPNNAVGTNAAYSGRTSPDALNDDLSIYTGTIMSGWACSPKTGMTVQLGGLAGTRDVAIAEDNAGNRLTINNRSAAPVEITLSGAPATNNRIDAIVAYVDNPSTGDGSTTDNPTTCGIIAVSGTVAANPSDPTDAQIRSAITTDGATGGSAYYAILAKITVGTGVTTIGSGVITQGAPVQADLGVVDNSVTTSKIADGAVTADKLNLSGLTPRIVKAGSVNIGSINANSDKTGSVTIPTQPDTDFIVLFSHQSKGNYYDRVAFTVTATTTASFSYAANNSSTSGTATNIVMGYVVVKYS